MLYNYFKIAIRTIWRDKFFSLINILGLAVGMATSLVIYQYVTYERSFDQYQTDSDQIYRIRVEGKTYAGEMQFQSARCYPVVGPTVKDRYPEVEEFARLWPREMIVSLKDEKLGNREFNENKICYVDPSFLKLFDIKVITPNDGNLLNRPSTFLISQRMAHKYFGDSNPVGKVLIVDGSDPIEVEGVFENFPANSHLDYDFLMSYETLGGGFFETSWGWNNVFIYLKLAKDTSIEKLEESFPAMIDEYKGEYFEATQYREDLFLQKLSDIHLTSNFDDEAKVNGNEQTVNYLGMISIFVLVLAWINYVNLTTAKSIQRAKEVGVRKTTGATRSVLIYQFLMEAFFTNLVSMAAALSLVQLFVPTFNAFTDMDIPFNLWLNVEFWLILPLVLVLGSAFSGIYPALVLSRYEPISVLKGVFSKSRDGQKTRKTLVVFQFTATVTLLIGTSIIFHQIQYMRDKNLGVDLEQTLVVKATNIYSQDSINGIPLAKQKIDLLQNLLSEHRAIKKVSVSESVPAFNPGGWGGYIRRAGADRTEARAYQLQAIDDNYLSLYDIELVTGRNFDRSKTTDRRKLLVNESAVKSLGFQSVQEALGAYIIYPFNNRQDNEEGEIIGIMKDWHQKSLHDEVLPIIFNYDPLDFDYVSIKLDVSSSRETMQTIESTWREVFVGNPFDYFFADQNFDKQYKSDKQFGRIILLFSVLSIFIATLGLAGLSVFNCSQRIKEIGIRKTLGASTFHLIHLLSVEVVMLIIVAGIIGVPVSYYFFNQWLIDFAFVTTIGWWTYLLPVIGVLVISVLIISVQTVKTAMQNPVESLRYE